MHPNMVPLVLARSQKCIVLPLVFPKSPSKYRGQSFSCNWRQSLGCGQDHNHGEVQRRCDCLSSQLIKSCWFCGLVSFSGFSGGVHWFCVKHNPNRRIKNCKPRCHLEDHQKNSQVPWLNPELRHDFAHRSDHCGLKQSSNC